MSCETNALNWIRHVAERSNWVTSVYTGSLVLGAARLLRGYRATCHLASRGELELLDAIPGGEASGDWQKWNDWRGITS